jgi:hypothetical protein
MCAYAYAIVCHLKVKAEEFKMETAVLLFIFFFLILRNWYLSTKLYIVTSCCTVLVITM